jgi:hypothetical protein
LIEIEKFGGIGFIYSLEKVAFGTGRPKNVGIREIQQTKKKKKDIKKKCLSKAGNNVLKGDF